MDMWIYAERTKDSCRVSSRYGLKAVRLIFLHDDNNKNKLFILHSQLLLAPLFS